MDREEEIANRIYSAIARILAAREECDITVTVKSKEDKHMDVTLYKGSEEYRISVMPESGKYLIYTPEECDEDGAPIDGAPWEGCDAIEEVNDLIAELMVDRELSFVPEDL